MQFFKKYLIENIFSIVGWFLLFRNISRFIKKYHRTIDWDIIYEILKYFF